MFTGIVEDVGKITRVESSRGALNLTIRSRTVTDGTILGDSICVNGTCLTVTDLTGDEFSAGLAPETLSRTNLGSVSIGTEVNLERALMPTSRMGGHIVQGHVDGTGTVTTFRPDGTSLWVHLKVEQDLMRYIVPKGFVTVDGVSLTVVETGEDWFSVMLVEYTQTHITLAKQRVGYRANIETDILGKYVENILTHRSKKKGTLSLAFMADNGYK
ncbi:MAG: riboflavin synthase [Bacteroidetes bacterium]|nr:MAG: riboflavin synthase [Bacteroidota bacterium]